SSLFPRRNARARPRRARSNNGQSNRAASCLQNAAQFQPPARSRRARTPPDHRIGVLLQFRVKVSQGSYSIKHYRALEQATSFENNRLLTRAVLYPTTACSRARYCIQSGHLAGLVFRIEFECAGSDLSEPLAAAQTDGECDQLVLTAKFKAPFGHTAIDLADVQRRIGLAQNNRRGLRNAKIGETDVARLFVLLQLGHLGFDLGLGRSVGHYVV